MWLLVMLEEQVPVGESEEVLVEDVGGFNGGQHEQRPGKAGKNIVKRVKKFITKK